MSDNWVVQNLENALETWNDKLSEIWQLLTTTPQDFKGGSIWNVMVTINGAVQAIGLALLVLFFVVGVVRTCGSFTDVKKPEHALKLFVRFAIAKGVITYGMELMLALFNIVQGIISLIIRSLIFTAPTRTSILNTSSPIYDHTCVTAAASGFTTGGLDANSEKIMQASTITAPSSSTAQ